MINISFKPGALEKIMRTNARTRLGWERLEEVAGKYDVVGARILDVGIHGDIRPGGHKYMFKEASYETIDIDPDVQPMHVGDIREMVFEDETFDMVICYAVLEHVLKDRDKAYKELLRVVKIGGTLCILVPTTLDRETEPSSSVTLQELKDAYPGAVIKTFEDNNRYVEVVK